MANWNQGGGGSLWWSLQECRCLLSSSSSPSERPWRRDAHVIVASLPVLSLRVCCSQKEHSRSWRAEGLTDGKGGGGKGEAGLQGKSLFLLTVDPLMTDGLGVGLKPFSYPDFCYACFLPSMRTSLVAQGQRIHLECRRFRLNPWVGKIPWRRAWQPTPVLLPGESHGQRRLEGYSPWGHQELDTIEWLSLSLSFHHIVQKEPTSLLGVHTLSGAISEKQSSHLPSLARWRQRWWDCWPLPRSIVEGNHETWTFLISGWLWPICICLASVETPYVPQNMKLRET